MTSQKKPDIPAHFKSINNLMGLYYIAHGLLLWLGCSALGHFVWSYPDAPLWAKVPLLLVLAVVSGFGMFFMALLGHEGFHGNLNRHRDLSMTMGILASSLTPFFVSTGYNVIHWQHHMHTNTPRDPDFILYRGNKTFLSRVFNGPRQTSTICLKNALALVFAPETLDRSFPFTKGKARVFALLNIFLMLSTLVVYASVAMWASQPVLIFFVVIPIAVSQTYWSMAPYIEHAGVGVGEGKDTRTVTSGIFKVLLMGYNYHLCHHLYPRVQLHKLPGVYRYLQSSGYVVAETPSEKSAVAALRIGATSVLDF